MTYGTGRRLPFLSGRDEDGALNPPVASENQSAAQAQGGLAACLIVEDKLLKTRDPQGRTAKLPNGFRVSWKAALSLHVLIVIDLDDSQSFSASSAADWIARDQGQVSHDRKSHMPNL
jgi:hypothetical protein